MTDFESVQAAQVTIKMSPEIVPHDAESVVVKWNAKIENAGLTAAVDVSQANWNIVVIAGTNGAYDEPENVEDILSTIKPQKGGEIIKPNGEIPLNSSTQLNSWNDVIGRKVIVCCARPRCLQRRIHTTAPFFHVLFLRF